MCKKFQLLTKNVSHADKELLWMWQATNQTFTSKIQAVNKSVNSLNRKLEEGFIIAQIEE